MGYKMKQQRFATIEVSTREPREKDVSTLRFIKFSPQNLKLTRKEFDVNQQEIADFMKVSRSMISMYEKKRDVKGADDSGLEPTLFRLQQISRFFSVKAGYKIVFFADGDDLDVNNEKEQPDYWGRS